MQPDVIRFAIGIMLAGATILQAQPGRQAVRFEGAESGLTLVSPVARTTWSATNGRLLHFSAPASEGIPILGESELLWRIVFADGSEVDSNAFLAPPSAGKMTHEWLAVAGRLVLTFSAPDLRVQVEIIPRLTSIDLVAAVEYTAKPLLRIDAPAVLRFPPETVRSVTFPQRAGKSVGVCFSKSFFRRQNVRDATAYGRTAVGPGPYKHLFGEGLHQLEDALSATSLRVTPLGRKWFPEAVIKTIEGHAMVINRPPAAGHMPLVLVESDNGPALCGSDLGGTGLLLRFTGKGDGRRPDLDSRSQTAMVLEASRALSIRRLNAFQGKRLAVIALHNGPENGGWTSTPVSRWKDLLSGAPFVRACGAVYETITSAAALRQALSDDRFKMILNPYGEWLPTGDSTTWEADVARIRDFVRRGGIWWEVGGYPFYYVLTPQPFLAYSEQYPSANADFFHLDSTAGSLAIFGVQPVLTAPWTSASSSPRFLTPASLETGGDERGGYFTHGWHAAVEPGDTWRSPPVRLLPGPSAPEALSLYGAAIGLKTPLAEKVPPAKLSPLCGAVLVRLGGRTAAEQIAALDHLPGRSIVHFHEYLHGGFDKQYPDHLPPRVSWGTPQDLSTFYRRGQELGHLMMPYTNASWWCIGPKGPTFLREGEDPLSRTRSGGLQRESYGGNEGYRVCFWDPAVQAAHRVVRRQMTVTYPSDILLQDQVGARSWRWDYHPAAPTETAGLDGMHSLSMEDARHVPLATEDGYDRVIEFETMLCGMGWAIVPSGARHERSMNRLRFPNDTWAIFPMMQYLAHDKALFTFHDLGHFITDTERLAYAVGLGYSLSQRTDLGALRRPGPRRWLFWLDAVQKGLCARYAGQPLLQHRYPFATELDPTANHTLVARYPEVVVVARTGGPPTDLASALTGTTVEPPPEADAMLTIPGPGFYAWGPQVRAGVVVRPGAASGAPLGFVMEKTVGGYSATLLAPPFSRARIPLPSSVGLPAGSIRELVPDSGTQTGPVLPLTLTRASAQWAELVLPSASAARGAIAMPDEAGREPPAEWTAWSTSIAVIDPGGDAPTSWVKASAASLFNALQASGKLKRLGLSITRLRSAQAVLTALRASTSERPFAVINPGGEVFYAPELAQADAVLDAIRSYVRTGGIWCETGGYSFHVCAARDDKGGWKRKHVGPGGARRLGFACKGLDVNAPVQACRVTDVGESWLGPERSTRLRAALVGVQRPFAGGREDTVLLRGTRDGFLSAIRCEGWGWLWRIGGFTPPENVVQDAITGLLEHLSASPWPRPRLTNEPRLWRVKLTQE
ncbi:MAG: hypothetical protein HN742_15635 [Lentisphaerae bacterium]|jgi:hypothetical protein|nr:hypothetical protein [Lentisphaerota bacterium]MBT4819805.1 hypothetical protein [Lentisphaerota bacterium]MBT5607759.1 hypothetical protein [Lentisphaerota bacterium]MBT7054922.1 hypothetical protein [Lentisphaerota bacterium]MBT7843308.1 hypothetical protein [Lentisphaerota bacterium]